MKRCWLRLAIAAAAGLAGAAPVQAATPRLVLSQPSWHFGEVWHGEKPSLRLSLRNDGDAELVLSEVRSTCGCTVAQPDRMRIPPGESTTIPVVFDTSGKQGDVGSKVIIRSNDPARAEVEFDIKGHVKRTLFTTPIGGLVLRSLEQKPGVTGRCRLENQLSQPLEIGLLSRDGTFLDVELVETAPGLAWDLVGRTTRALAPGTYRGNIQLRTNSPRDPTVTVPFQVVILNLVEAQPPAIYLKPDDPRTSDKPEKRTITFRYYGNERFEITGANCSHPDVRFKLNPAQPPTGGMAQLDPRPTYYTYAVVDLPPARSLPQEGLTLEFQTNDPQVPTVTVLVTKDLAEFQRRVHGVPGPGMEEVGRSAR